MTADELLRSLEFYTPSLIPLEDREKIDARNVVRVEAAMKATYNEGQRQGWLDVARRDKTADQFAEGLQVGLIIAESRVATREAALAAAKEKAAAPTLDDPIGGP